MPLGVDAEEEETVSPPPKQFNSLQGVPVTNLALKKGDSEKRYTGLNKVTLKHITNLLEDDDECFCRDNVHKLIM